MFLVGVLAEEIQFMEMPRAFLRAGGERLVRKRRDRPAQPRGPHARYPRAAARGSPLSLEIDIYLTYLLSLLLLDRPCNKTLAYKTSLAVFFISCFTERVFVNLQLMVQEVKKCIEDHMCTGH